jgi:hypothetical protein
MSFEAPTQGDECRQEVGYVFRRRQVKTHGQLMRDELSEGFGHLWQAAAHAAGGIGATVGPKWDSAKGHLPRKAMRGAAVHGWESTLAAFAPLMEAARSSAVEATKNAQKARNKAMKKESGMARKRATILISLLAAGAAAGAAGAMMAKRRNRARWQEYEARGADAMRSGGQKLASAAERAGQTVSSWTDAARDTVREGTESATGSRDNANIFAEQTKQTAGSMSGRTAETLDAGKAHSMSKNTRS